MAHLWIDLETTGIDEKECKIIEVAYIISEDIQQGWEEITRDSDVASLGDYDPCWTKGAYEMHKTTGLIHEVNSTVAKDLGIIEGEILDKIEAAGIVEGKDHLYLSARNPSFERRFIEEHMPLLNAMLHYREFDVTTWMMMASLGEKLDDIYSKKEDEADGVPHRAMYDVDRDYNICKALAEELVDVYGEVEESK